MYYYDMFKFYFKVVNGLKKLNAIPVIPKSHQITWWVCRAALFIWGTVLFFQGYTVEFLQAIFAIVFTHLWDLFQLLGGKSFITKVPYNIFTGLNFFIAFGSVVGTTVNKFTTFDYIDVPEHFFAGYIAAVGGYELAVIIQSKQPVDKRISPALASLFAFAFSVAISVGWEFYEFTMDRLYGLNLQRTVFNSEGGLVDTMVDLILCAGGALTGMFYSAFSHHNKEKKALNKPEHKRQK